MIYRYIIAITVVVICVGEITSATIDGSINKVMIESLNVAVSRRDRDTVFPKPFNYNLIVLAKQEERILGRAEYSVEIDITKKNTPPDKANIRRIYRVIPKKLLVNINGAIQESKSNRTHEWALLNDGTLQYINGVGTTTQPAATQPAAKAESEKGESELDSLILGILLYDLRPGSQIGGANPPNQLKTEQIELLFKSQQFKMLMCKSGEISEKEIVLQAGTLETGVTLMEKEATLPRIDIQAQLTIEQESGWVSYAKIVRTIHIEKQIHVAEIILMRQ